MRLGLLGMSGVGKTYWATKLAEAGFECWHCDDLIAARLQTILGQPLVTSYDMGHWMGFPYEPGFKEREEIFVSCEAEVLQEIIDHLAQERNSTSNLVVDMTGSAIYAGESIFTCLREFIAVVYLSLSSELHQYLLSEYAAHPVSLVWQGQFHKKADETNALALAHCYSHLIAFRESRYEKYCDITLEYHTHRRGQLTSEEFLQCIRKAAH